MNATSSSVRLGAMDLYHGLPCPDGWTTRRLRFVTRINKAQPILLAPEDEVSFVPMAAIGEHGGIQLEQVKALDDIGDRYTYFADGDVVVAKITPCFENGKGAFAEGLKNGIAFGTTELHVIRPAKEIDGRFLFYLSISELFRNLGEGAMYGAGGQKRVPDQFIKDFQALLPPLDQQKIIAAFLDRKTAEIDTLTAKKRRLRDRLAEKRIALITRAVTKGLNPDAPMKDSGIEWLGEIPAHWKCVRLRFMADVGPSAKGLVIGEDAEISFVPMANVGVCGGLTLEQTKTLSDVTDGYTYFANDDILVAKITPCFENGKGALAEDLLNGVGFGTTELYVVRPKSLISPRLMFYITISDAFRKVGEGAMYGAGGQKRVPEIFVKDFPIPVPPSYEQEEIVDFLLREERRFETIRSKVLSVIEKLQEYRSALITNAVTGQIKVA